MPSNTRRAPDCNVRETDSLCRGLFSIHRVYDRAFRDRVSIVR